MLLVEITVPLLVALIVLWIDRKLRDNDEFDSVMDGLVGELCQNLSIVRTQEVGIDRIVDLMKKGGWNTTPDPLLSNDAYHRAVASEVFFRDMRKNSEGVVRNLMEHYASQEVVNEGIRQLNQAKFDYLVFRNISISAFEVLFAQQKETIEKVIEPSIVGILIMVSSIKTKYRKTIGLYVNLPSKVK